ncbi:MAG: hypothetical protein JWM71_1033 [Solirubrobacteraceae bacterium]|nr:hypothetical protein [Solirubrobacteraceae bacterium]
MRGSLLLAVLVAGVLALPGAAPAYPPITCGRTTLTHATYIVRTHGPTCTFAIKWVRAYIGHHRHPSGFRCRAYGKDVPADCVGPKGSKKYFLASPAP